MSEAIGSSDASVAEVTDLTIRHQQLQTEFIKNENRVKMAAKATATAKTKARSANGVLYQLNNEFSNISNGLQAKTVDIGSAKDLAVRLQERANDLSTSSSNKLASINGTHGAESIVNEVNLTNL